jgi:hypothetical protein
MERMPGEIMHTEDGSLGAGRSAAARRVWRAGARRRGARSERVDAHNDQSDITDAGGDGYGTTAGADARRTRAADRPGTVVMAHLL